MRVVSWLIAVMVCPALASSPPVSVDDGDVPDKGEHEFNFLAASQFNRNAQTHELVADLNWGQKFLGHRIQLKVEMPLTLSRVSSDSDTEVGGVEAGVKVVLLDIDSHFLGVSIFPNVEFPRFSGGDENLTSGTMKVIVGKRMSDWRLDTQSAYVFNRDESIWNFGASLSRTIGGNWAVLLSGAREDRRAVFELGAVRAISPRSKLLLNAGSVRGGGEPNQIRLGFGLQLL